MLGNFYALNANIRFKHNKKIIIQKIEGSKIINKMNMLLVLIFNYVAIFRPYQYLSKKFNIMQKYAYPMYIAFAILLVFFHLIYYTKTHESNYFELLGMNRLFTPEELTQAQKIKLSRLQDELGLIPQTQEKIDKINKIHATLDHVTLCQMYDKYKAEDGRIQDLYFNSLNLQKIIQDLMEYLIAFIVLSFITKEENLKGSRKWMAAVMMMFFSNEVNMYLGRRDHYDWFFDSYFSQFAIFDRILLIRYCMVPCLLTIRLNFLLFNKTTFLKMSDQIRMTLDKHQEISRTYLRYDGQQTKQILDKIENNIKKSIEKIEGEHQNIKEQEVKKKSGCWKCTKICLYIFLGMVILQFFLDKNYEVIYTVDHDDY